MGGPPKLFRIVLNPTSIGQQLLTKLRSTTFVEKTVLEKTFAALFCLSKNTESIFYLKGTFSKEFQNFLMFTIQITIFRGQIVRNI
jgi:hypothetical protein